MLHKSIVLAAAFAAMAAAIPVELAPERLSECPENENYNGRECVCDRGFERSREGGCVKPTAAVRCGRNEVPNPRGGCDCDRGFDMTREGCVEPTTAVKCGRNEVPDSRGGCKCDRGFELTREGCVATMHLDMCISHTRPPPSLFALACTNLPCADRTHRRLSLSHRPLTSTWLVVVHGWWCGSRSVGETCASTAACSATPRPLPPPPHRRAHLRPLIVLPSTARSLAGSSASAFSFASSFGSGPRRCRLRCSSTRSRCRATMPSADGPVRRAWVRAWAGLDIAANLELAKGCRHGMRLWTAVGMRVRGGGGEGAAGPRGEVTMQVAAAGDDDTRQKWRGS